MAIRYNELKKRTAQHSDFVSRRYNPSLVKIMLLFFAALGACICVVSLLLRPFEMVVVLTILLGALGAYVISKLQNTRDLVVTTEFQNALFASALSSGCRFCCIIARDGGISYMDQGTQRLFEDLLKERQLTLATLLKLGKVPVMEQDKILDIVSKGTRSQVVCEMRGHDNRLHQLILSIEPIKRPSGFFLMRARDYVEERDNARSAGAPKVAINPLLSKSTIGMFAHVMDRMGMGLYMIDMAGNLLYANPQLERWLGFNEGEVTAGNFSMRDVLHGITAADSMNPGDFEGEHSLVQKQGGLIKAYINQKIVYGDANKPLGCVALITNIIQGQSEAKRTLW